MYFSLSEDTTIYPSQELKSPRMDLRPVGICLEKSCSAQEKINNE
jgi:hypothetical protein